jgi:hypothetical protein
LSVRYNFSLSAFRFVFAVLTQALWDVAIVLKIASMGKGATVIGFVSSFEKEEKDKSASFPGRRN